jgi:hypothetical protein
VFRDLEKASFFWSPAKWENRGALDAWRMSGHYNAGLALVADDVLEHKTHLMESVPQFPNQSRREMTCLRPSIVLKASAVMAKADDAPSPRSP